MFRLCLTSAAVVGLTALPTFADEFAPVMRDYFENNVAGWITDGALVDAIRAQNAKTAAYNQSDIDTLDQTWRAQVGTADASLVDATLNHPASGFLRDQVMASGGVITEAFAMDALGLNVAASSATSDYWQGDEAKFQQTYGKGVGAVHVADVEFDESTQTYSGQVSAVIVDPDTNTPIGAITIGLNAEALM